MSSTGDIPDARDGLTRAERIILRELAKLTEEKGGSVKTAMLYGRVVEHVDLSQEEFQEILARLLGKG